ncbi:MAG: DUF4150 domain-containing protein [Myxococcales bacterium]|nr:DUF4150 domain-containing protein [Myxococcales bacterium]
MFPASTKEGGQCFGFPDVCKVPAPPAPPIPTPFPNIAMCANASGASVTQKVKIRNKQVLHKSSEIPNSSGDEPGTLGGMISGVNMSKAVYKTASSKVLVEGKYIVTHLKTTPQNGSRANVPMGTQVAPSQTKVIIGR